MTTATSFNAWLAKPGWVRTDAGRFPAKVVDAREVFGRLDLKIVPLGHDGDGRWVSAERFERDSSLEEASDA